MSFQTDLPAVNAVAATGFNLQVDAYEAARPTYPHAVLELLKEKLHLVPGESKVLDLAAGTGKLTRLLDNYGYKLSAVEPAPNMREKFKAVLPNVPLYDGTAWKIPFEDQSLDAVIVAQGFHWFDDLPALKEMHRVLKPGGYLGLIWNMEDKKARKWIAKARDLYEFYDEGVPQYRKGNWRKVWETSEAASLYHPLETEFVHHEILNDRDTIWRRVLSKSYISVLPADKLERLRADVYAVLEDPEGDVEVDPATGLVKCAYETEVVWAKRRD